MREMFRNCSSLTSLDLSSFDTTNVTDMHYMFCACPAWDTVDQEKFAKGACVG